MRKVTKDFDAVPAVLLSAECQQLIARSLVEKGAHDFQTGVYGHEAVRAVLDVIYQHKCAFCETDTSAGATLQVEHYRPKAKVTEPRKPTISGYYWLGYQWSNLLLACPRCNNRKRNRFPVGNGRVGNPPVNADGSLDAGRCRADGAELLAEIPQLVNPELDPNPMQHFRFQANGTIDHKTELGEATIETCHLNRDRLVVWRKKVYDNLLNKFITNFNRFENNEINAEQLKTLILFAIKDDLIAYINNDSNQYLEFAKTCWVEFETFFLSPFDAQPNFRQILKTVYDDLVAEMA